MNRISTQLVVSFLIVALLPTLPLSLVVRDLLERRFGPAIAEPLEQALDSGLAESRVHLQELLSNLSNRATELGAGVLDQDAYLLDVGGHVQPADSLAVFLADRPGLMDQAKELEVFASGSAAMAERLGETLAICIGDAGGATSVFLLPLPRGMVDRAGDLTSGISLLRVVRGEDGRVISSFVGPFLLVYGLLILVALGVGIGWSRQMVKPLEALVGATARVAQGDLEFRIKEKGPGEVGDLVKGFDRMVENLARQRRDLARLERVAAWRGMARTLAHEVKNPLTPIVLAVNQARDCYEGDDEKYRALLAEVSEIVGEEVESLRRLVRQFGDFAQLPKPELQPGDLQEMLVELVQLYGSECLQLESLSTEVSCWFDHDALRRALINLIDNGLAACEEAGKPKKVQLKSILIEAGMQLVITDDGSGIPEAHRARVFEPDFTTKSGGMGLGLAIVENIILGHGGRITVESEMGHGAQFTITLPLAPSGASRQSSRDGEL